MAGTPRSPQGSEHSARVREGAEVSEGAFTRSASSQTGGFCAQYARVREATAAMNADSRLSALDPNALSDGGLPVHCSSSRHSTKLTLSLAAR